MRAVRDTACVLSITVPSTSRVNVNVASFVSVELNVVDSRDVIEFEWFALNSSAEYGVSVKLL
jgi:hypothetical protein